MGGTGAEGDDDVAFFAHLPGHLKVLLVLDAAAHKANCCLGNIHVLFVSKLTKMLVIHENGDMHKVNPGKKIKQSFPKVQDCDFTACTGIEPLIGYIDSHYATSLRLNRLGPSSFILFVNSVTFCANLGPSAPETHSMANRSGSIPASSRIILIAVALANALLLPSR